MMANLVLASTRHEETYCELTMEGGANGGVSCRCGAIQRHKSKGHGGGGNAGRRASGRGSIYRPGGV
jgi:hypothetical protein